MSDETLRQSIIDEEHLKLLSLGYLVSGGFNAMFSLFGVMYLVIGIVMAVVVSHAPETAAKGEPGPALVGYFFGGVGLVVFLVMMALAIGKFWAALCIRRRKSRTYCMVVAGISCVGFPYGMLLGVLSFVVLGRDSVARLFVPAAPPTSG
ncbi:MAG: hypothetical protein ABSA70_17450 [Terriglobia bacterium]